MPSVVIPLGYITTRATTKAAANIDSPRSTPIHFDGGVSAEIGLFGFILSFHYFKDSGEKDGECKSHCPVKVSHDHSF